MSPSQILAAHRSTARPHGVVSWCSDFAVLCAAVVAVGLGAHPPAEVGDARRERRQPLVRRPAHRHLTDVADVGTLLGETVTGVVVLAVLGHRVRRLEADVVAAGLRRRVRCRARPLLPRRDDAGPAPATAGPHPAVRVWSRTPASRPVTPARRPRSAACSPRCCGPTPGSPGGCSCCWWWSRRTPWSSRLYVGAHHVSDVLTAFVYAGLWLLLCARMLLPARRSEAQPGSDAGSPSLSSVAR